METLAPTRDALAGHDRGTVGEPPSSRADRALLTSIGVLGCLVTTAWVVRLGPAEPTVVSRVVGRLDVFAPAVVALGIYLLVRRAVGRSVAGHTSAVLDRVDRVRLAVLWPSWWALVVLQRALVELDEASARELAITALVFVVPGGSAPPGLEAGGTVLSIAAGAVVIAALCRSVSGRAGPHGRATALLTAGVALVMVGVLVHGARALLGTAEWGLDAGPADRLPAIGIALIAAVGGTSDRAGTAPADAKGLMSAVANVGAAAARWALPITAIGLTLAVVASDDGHPPAHADALVVAAIGLVIAVAVTSRAAGEARRTARRARPARRRLATWRWSVILAAPGWVAAGPLAATMIAAQHTARVTTDPAGRTAYLGPVAPLAMWTVITAAGVGVALAVGVFVPWRRRLGGPPGGVTWRTALAGVAAFAFLIRIGTWIRVAPPKTDGGDPLFYHVTANLIAEGRGFLEPLNWLDAGRSIPSALHGPLYPVVLAGSSVLNGRSYVDHKFVSILIGTALVVVTAVLGRRLGGRRVGIVAGVLAALYPNLWLIDSLLYPEGLFALLTTSAVLVAYRWWDHPRRVSAAALGAFIALAALTRGEGLLLAPLVAMPWFLTNRTLTLGERWRHLVVAGAACIAVLVPWTVRNAVTFEEPVPLSTNGNELLVYANCDDVYSGRLLGFWSFECQQRHRAEFGEPPGDESEKARYWREVGLDYAGDHIDQVPKVVAARVLRQWELFRPHQTIEFSTIENRDRDAAALGLVAYYGLAAGAIAGAVILRRRGTRLLPLAAQVVAVTITAAYAYGTVRFRAPVEPVLCVLAAVAFAPMLSRLRGRWLPADIRPRSDPASDPSAFVLGGSRALRPGSSSARATWLGIGIVALLIALPLRGLYRTTGGTMEEGFMLAFPELVGEGWVPNVDFVHLYGPGSLHALWAWYEVLGNSLVAERTFGLVQHLGIVFGLFALARPWGRAAATAVAATSVLLVVTPIGLTAMAWNGGLALTVWATVFALRGVHLEDPVRARRAGFLAGLLGGLALAYRPDLVLAIAAVAAIVIWQRRPAWRSILAGGMVGAIPMWFHVAVAGPVAAFEGMVVDPVVRLRPGRELPRPPSWDRLDGALQAIAETAPPWWRLPALPASASISIWFWAMLAAAVGLSIVAVWLVRRTGAAPRAIVLLAGAAVSVGIVPQAWQRPDSTHLSWVVCISWPLLILAVLEVLRVRRAAWHPRRRLVAASGAVVAMLLVIAPLFTFRYYLHHVRVSLGDAPPALAVEREGRRFYLGDVPPWRATQAVLDELGSLAVPGERLFVGPADLRRTWYGDTFFYWMFPELVPATRFLELDPGLANRDDSGLADDVSSADWLILTRFWDGWSEPNASMDFGSDAPNDVVRTQFCEVASYEGGLVTLLRRCDAPTS